MKRTLIVLATTAALAAAPNLAIADPDATGNAAAGAAIGAGAGFLFGGPLGAVIGAGVGGTMGAAGTPTHDDVVVEERRRAPVRERSCTRDSRGNVACEDIRR